MVGVPAFIEHRLGDRYFRRNMLGKQGGLIFEFYGEDGGKGPDSPELCGFLTSGF